MSKSSVRKHKAQRHIDAAKSITVGASLEQVDDYSFFDEEETKKIPVWVLTAYIDGEPVKETHDVLALFHEFYPVHIGYDENKARGHYFLTCSCGVAGCAGYWEPAVIRVKKYTVQWSVRKKHGYRKGVIGTGENVIYLKRKDYEEAREFMLGMMRTMPEANFMIAGHHMKGRKWVAAIEKYLK